MFLCVCSKVDRTPIIILALLDPEFERGWKPFGWNLRAFEISENYGDSNVSILCSERENWSREQTKIKTCPQEDLFLYSFSKKIFFFLKWYPRALWYFLRTLFFQYKWLKIKLLCPNVVNFYSFFEMIFFMFTRNKSLIVEETAHV
jgi:hypothetical protein